MGEVETEFTLHKKLLAARGGQFFAGILNGQFVESHANQVLLPEENPLAFELFVDWLYAGNIPGILIKDEWKKPSDTEVDDPSDDDDAVKDDPANNDPIMVQLEITYHDLYYLGDKWCITAIKDKALECIREFHRKTDKPMDFIIIERAYANTRKSSPLRQYVAERLAYRIATKVGVQLDAILDYSTEGMMEFQNDILKAFAALKYSIDDMIDPDLKDSSEPESEGSSCTDIEKLEEVNGENGCPSTAIEI